MSGNKKRRNVDFSRSFIHFNPAPKTKPPFSALRVPDTEPSTRTQSNETSNPDNVTSTDK